jgi:hypothetical protein
VNYRILNFNPIIVDIVRWYQGLEDLLAEKGTVYAF